MAEISANHQRSVEKPEENQFLPAVDRTHTDTANSAVSFLWVIAYVVSLAAIGASFLLPEGGLWGTVCLIIFAISDLLLFIGCYTLFRANREMQVSLMRMLQHDKAERSRQSQSSKPRRQFGSAKGLFTTPDDFNEPLEDFEEYM